MGIKELIWDEVEAIEGYAKYLKDHPEDTEVIKSIIADEEKHIIILTKLKRR